MKTYRYRGHSMSDPAKYRTRDEVQKIRAERDCIDNVRQLLLAGKHVTHDDLKAIDKEIKATISAAANLRLKALSQIRPSFGQIFTPEGEP